MSELFIYIIIFCVLLFLLFIIPKIMIFLFRTIIGLIIIFTIIYLITRKKNSFRFNHTFAFGLFMIFIIFYLSIYKSVTVASLPVASLPVASLKEGYISSSWSNDLIDRFLSYQYYHNPKYIFDINILQTQATPTEVENYLKNGKWYWSYEVETLYKNYIIKAPFVGFDVESSMENAKKIYNEKAITELMAWNSKEGQFILNGAVVGQSDNLPQNINNQIKCNTKGEMMKIINKDVDIYPGYMIQEKTIIRPEDIPKTLSGFKFIDGPCNPCLQSIQGKEKNDCKFTINIGDGGEISSIWDYIWGTKKKISGRIGTYPPKVDPLYERSLSTNVIF